MHAKRTYGRYESTLSTRLTRSLSVHAVPNGRTRGCSPVACQVCKKLGRTDAAMRHFTIALDLHNEVN